MSYAIEMGSDALIYIQSFIMIGSVIKMLMNTKTRWAYKRTFILSN
jgi:hypothetical protein